MLIRDNVIYKMLHEHFKESCKSSGNCGLSLALGSQMADLTIASFNARGLNVPEKRTQILYHLHKRKKRQSLDERCKSLSGSQKLTQLLCTHADYKQTGHR
ncbi:uncharacterized protein ACNLHF_021655 isoform 2-T2 [Anomaloglossus baeobatrachus]